MSTQPPDAGVGTLVRQYVAHALQDPVPQSTCLYKLVMRATEKPLIEAVLYALGGNQVRAAAALGINRNSLRTKMRLHGLLK